VTDSVEVALSGLSATGRLRPVAVGLVIAGLAVGAGVAVWLKSRGPDPEPTKPPPVVEVPPRPGTQPPVEPPPAEPLEVEFDIDSTPQGARVTSRGTPLGETPVRHTVKVPAGQKAELELTFTMEGFQSVTETWVAEGPRRAVHAKLRRRILDPGTHPGTKRARTEALLARRRAPKWWWVLLLVPSVALADARVEARKRFRAGMALIGEGNHEEGVDQLLLEAYSI
jgi:hypothetical protein